MRVTLLGFGALWGLCCTAPAAAAVGAAETLGAVRAAQPPPLDPALSDPVWQADYTATRPKVERKIGHLMRRKHGGRRARMRGLAKVAADFALLAAAVNLARLGTLGLTSTTAGNWTIATA